MKNVNEMNFIRTLIELTKGFTNKHYWKKDSKHLLPKL